ncbi:MAG: hypothetical protein ACRCX2_09595 [Paraclostridium sp.]
MFNLKLKAGNFAETFEIKIGEIQTQSLGATLSELQEFDGFDSKFKSIIREATVMVTEIKKENREVLKPKNADQKTAFITGKIWEKFEQEKARLVESDQDTKDLSVFKHVFAHDLAFNGVGGVQLKKINGARLTFATEEIEGNKAVTLFVTKFNKTLTVETKSIPKKIGTWIFTNNPDFVAPEGTNVVRKSFELDNFTFEPIMKTDEKLYKLCIQSLEKVSNARKENRNATIIDICESMDKEVSGKVVEIEKNLEEIANTLKYFTAGI